MSSETFLLYDCGRSRGGHDRGSTLLEEDQCGFIRVAHTRHGMLPLDRKLTVASLIAASPAAQPIMWFHAHLANAGHGLSAAAYLARPGSFCLDRTGPP
jgi:hypothetical protein